jgi:hypothetical protein
MKRIFLFGAVGLLCLIGFSSGAFANDRHPVRAQIHLHMGPVQFWAGEIYTVFPSPIYVVPVEPVYVIPPVPRVYLYHEPHGVPHIHHRHPHHDHDSYYRDHHPKKHKRHFKRMRDHRD